MYRSGCNPVPIDMRELATHQNYREKQRSITLCPRYQLHDSAIQRYIRIHREHQALSLDNGHMCYVIYCGNYFYVGYTVNFFQRLRKHNKEIVGGAHRTASRGPWYPLCVIHGFNDDHSALRFEYRLQHPKPKLNNSNRYRGTIAMMDKIIHGNDSIKAENTGGRRRRHRVTIGIQAWPQLTIHWFRHDEHNIIQHPNVINTYWY